MCSSRVRRLDAPNVVGSRPGRAGSATRELPPHRRAHRPPGDGQWRSTGDENFARPTPTGGSTTHASTAPTASAPLDPAVPGRANRGTLPRLSPRPSPWAPIRHWPRKRSGPSVRSPAATAPTAWATTIRTPLAKNPAGWQEALSMIDQDADSLVIAVNGQVPDGEDLSWLWDVRSRPSRP